MLFSSLVDLGPEGYRANGQHHEVRLTRHCGLKQLDAAAESGKDIRQPFSFGMAWAAQRKILEGHSLYDAMIIGSGDRAMVHAMYGQFEVPLLHLNKPRQEHYLRWARGYYSDVAGKIGNVPGRIFHFWHGNFINRNSQGRQRLLAGFDYDPDLDLRIGPNGAWHWARPRPDLEDFLKSYFISRAEDE